MRVSEANELFLGLTKEFFANATVVFASQSRTAKPKIPLVTIKPGNVKRPHSPGYMTVGGESIGYYHSRLSFTVDLFTHGSPVRDGTGKVVAYANVAVDDMLSYADFLNSEYVVAWCRDKDVSILIEGDAQDLTGIVNDNNYEYRSRLTVLFYFMQKTVGSAAVWAEDSIQYPVYETDTETGEPTYTEKEPVPKTDTTGDFKDDSEISRESAVIKPVPIQPSTGAVKKDLVSEETGYFDKVVIEEELINE